MYSFCIFEYPRNIKLVLIWRKIMNKENTPKNFERKRNIYIVFKIPLKTKITVDPHFSRAHPLDWRNSLLFWKSEKISFGKNWSHHLFYFYFRGKIKQERKTLKSNSIIFGKKCMSLKNLSLSLGIRLPIRKVPLKGSTPLSPIEVSTN